jgi:hypothetical protein
VREGWGREKQGTRGTVGEGTVGGGCGEVKGGTVPRDGGRKGLGEVDGKVGCHPRSHILVFPIPRSLLVPLSRLPPFLSSSA